MTAPKVLRLLAHTVAVTLCAAGCSETPYVFFGSDPRQECGDGSCDCATGCGGDPLSGGGGAAGSGGTEPADAWAGPGEDCQSTRLPAATLERLQLAVSELCVSQGAYAPLRGQTSYATTLVECSESVAQMWALNQLDDRVLEIRNEAVDLNLDVRFAASDDATPIVLFDPHLLYNQQFSVLEGDAAGSFKLAPLHAPTKCLTEADGSLILLPCEQGLDAQSFRRTACR